MSIEQEANRMFHDPRSVAIRLRAENEELRSENADLKASSELLTKELQQMYITETALRESLTGLSRESVEYRHKIETENDALKAEIKSVVDSLNTAASIGGFDGYDADTPLLVNVTSHWNRLCLIVDKEVEKLQKENADLKEALRDIATTAHCIAKAGPLNTPTLQDAWGKFMKIDSMASNALSKSKTQS